MLEASQNEGALCWNPGTCQTACVSANMRSWAKIYQPAPCHWNGQYCSVPKFLIAMHCVRWSLSEVNIRSSSEDASSPRFTFTSCSNCLNFCLLYIRSIRFSMMWLGYHQVALSVSFLGRCCCQGPFGPESEAVSHFYSFSQPRFAHDTFILMILDVVCSGLCVEVTHQYFQHFEVLLFICHKLELLWKSCFLTSSSVFKGSERGERALLFITSMLMFFISQHCSHLDL